MRGIRSVPTTSSSAEGRPRITFRTSEGATKLSPTQRYATQTTASSTTSEAATAVARRCSRNRPRAPIVTRLYPAGRTAAVVALMRAPPSGAPA